jgi:hypothetical protein
MANTKTHPVWDVYDFYRTSRLNVKYYGHRQNRIQNINIFMQIMIAVTASSTVGTAWLWSEGIGEVVWKVLGLVAAILAVSAPIINLAEQIRKYDEALVGWRGLHHDLQKIVLLITQKKAYDLQCTNEFQLAIDRKGSLDRGAPEKKENTALIKRLEKQVFCELPVDQFYVPTE